jgi:hypothetical protein
MRMHTRDRRVACRECGRAIPEERQVYCDALCASAWRQAHGAPRERAGTRMTREIIATLHGLLRHEPVERSDAMRFYAWLRESDSCAVGAE